VAIRFKLKDLIGKTVTNIEVLRAEYGRTYNNYLCFTCSDGTRVLLYGGEPYGPNPDLKEMRRVKFFTPEEIAEKVKKEEIRRREKIAEREQLERREYERLKKKFGE